MTWDFLEGVILIWKLHAIIYLSVKGFRIICMMGQMIVLTFVLLYMSSLGSLCFHHEMQHVTAWKKRARSHG